MSNADPVRPASAASLLFGRLLLSASLLTLGSGGCGDEAPHDPETNVDPVEAPEPSPARAESIYDALGNLRESDVVVAGLRLPMGLEEDFREERRHTFTSRVPPLRLRAYFSERLITGQIDDMGNGAVYRNAVPRTARGGVVQLDVSVLPAGRGRTRVEVREIPPPPAKMPTEEEAREALERAMRSWD